MGIYPGRNQIRGVRHFSIASALLLRGLVHVMTESSMYIRLRFPIIWTPEPANKVWNAHNAHTFNNVLPAL